MLQMPLRKKMHDEMSSAAANNDFQKQFSRRVMISKYIFKKNTISKLGVFHRFCNTEPAELAS
jgi:DNA topoisomerase IB